MKKIKPYQITLTEKEEYLIDQRDIFKKELIDNYNSALKAMLIWLYEQDFLNCNLTTDELLQTYLYSKEFQ